MGLRGSVEGEAQPGLISRVLAKVLGPIARLRR